MTPDSDEAQRAARDRLVMDYPVTLRRLPDALLPDDAPAFGEETE